ncbi:MAG: hypothetical protein IT430_14555 [Phycisphaerales bacterium]|nr:hypothetical protein [Phycisphaerales bacterium]
MHTLTKVFIVLWALLSVFIMALAVPLVMNNDTWKARYQAENASRLAADNSAKLASQQLDLVNIAKAQSESALNKIIAGLREDLASQTTRMADLRSQLATARQEKDAIQAQINRLAAAAETNADIIETQGEEITRRRDESLQLMSRSTELEDQLRDTLSRLDVALDAQRTLQEQIQELAERLQSGGTGAETASTSEEVTPIPSPLVSGRVMSVQTGADGNRYLEVNLGSRDGVSENMKFLIARGGKFLGNLIITKVELNRAVGFVQLEQDKVMINDEVRGGLRAGL